MTSRDHGSAHRLAAETSRLIDSLPRAIVVHSLDGTVIGWNGNAERVFGWPATEVLGKRFGEPLILPVDRASIDAIVASAVAGESWAGELSVRHAAGNVVRIMAQVAPLRAEDDSVIGTVTAAEDVTDVRELERLTSELADHLTLALAAGELGTWHWNRSTGATSWDNTVLRLFGGTGAPFDGRREEWLDRLHPDDVEPTLAAFAAAVSDRAPFELEHRVIWPDGSVHWLHGRGMVIVDDAGDVTGAIGCTTDITTRKLAELEAHRLAESAESMAAAERLHRERVEFLSTLNEAALSTSNLEELMGVVTKAAVPRLGDWCTLHFIREPNSAPIVEVAHVDPSRLAWVTDLQSRYPFDPNASSGVAAVVRTGETEFIQIDDAYLKQAIDESELPEDEAREIVDVLQLTSLITVPLRTKRGVVGAMQFVSAESGRRYDSNDVALATAAAGRIAAALDNAWLSDQHRHVAASLQQALLPVAVPSIEGLTVAVRYWAAGTVNEVGGDFYDIFRIGPTRWAVVIGDVCGTGPQAAAVTAKARHTIRAAATHGFGHVEVLEWVNDAILASGRERFCTVLFSTLDRNGDGTWTLTSVAGGHPLPIHVAQDGSVRRLGRPGTLVGALRTLDLHVTETTLTGGDTVVAFTDGVTDVRPPYGLDDRAMSDLVGQAAAVAGPAEVVAERLGEEIAAILPVPDRGDDVALVVVRIDLSQRSAA